MPKTSKVTLILAEQLGSVYYRVWFPWFSSAHCTHTWVQKLRLTCTHTHLWHRTEVKVLVHQIVCMKKRGWWVQCLYCISHMQVYSIAKSLPMLCMYVECSVWHSMGMSCSWSIVFVKSSNTVCCLAVCDSKYNVSRLDTSWTLSATASVSIKV